MRVLMYKMVLVLGLGCAAAHGEEKWRQVFERKQFQHGETVLRYRLATLGGKEADKWPLVVMLHGSGERGEDNEAPLKHGMKDLVAWCADKKQACVVLVPQCPQGSSWATLEGNRKVPEETKMKSEPNETMRALLALLETMRKDGGLDEKRLYVTGLSMGGYGSFDILARHPELFAAAMPVCGGADLSQAAKIKDVPIWVFHGDQDRAVPVEMSRAMVVALKTAGGQPKYREYPKVGHDSWTPTYADPEVWAWLFAQKKP